MKKAIRVNISGIVFNIDEDAFLILEKYLSTLKAKFGDGEDAKEILNDIEARIAEIFQEKITNSDMVVDKELIDHTISVLGQPEQYDDATEVDETISKDNTSSVKSKRLYRDSDDRYLAGISSGLGHYFNVNPMVFRVLFLASLFFAGTGFFIYLVLWIVIPEAKTTAQKLEMKGAPVTIDNIEKLIKDEVKEVGKSLNNLNESKGFQKFLNVLRTILLSTGKVLMVFGRILAVLIGAFLIIVPLSLLTALIGLLYFPLSLFSPAKWIDPSFSMSDFMQYIVPQDDVFLMTFTVSLVIGLPLLMFIMWGLKLIFRFDFNSKPLNITLSVAWSIGVIMMFFMMASIGRQYAENVDDTRNYELNLSKSDTLYLTLNQIAYDDAMIDEHHIQMGDLYFKKVDNIPTPFIKPSLAIKIGIDSLGSATAYSRIHASSKLEAKQLIKKMNYQWRISGDSIIFDPLVAFPDKKIRPIDSDLEVYIPVGKIVYIEEELLNILDDIDVADEEVWYHEMGNKYWIMTENGLKSTNTDTKEDDEESMKSSVDSVSLSQSDLDEMKKELKK